MGYIDEFKEFGTYKVVSESEPLKLYERLLNFTYEQPYGEEPYSLENLLKTIDAVSRIIPTLMEQKGAYTALASTIVAFMMAHKTTYETKIAMAKEVTEAQKELLEEQRKAKVEAAEKEYTGAAENVDNSLQGLQGLEQYLQGLK